MPVDAVATWDLYKQDMSSSEDAGGSLLEEKSQGDIILISLIWVLNTHWLVFTRSTKITVFSETKEIKLLEIRLCEEDVYYIWGSIH